MTKKKLYPHLFLFLTLLGCHNSKPNTIEEEIHSAKVIDDTVQTQEINYYNPKNMSISGFWGDTTDTRFDSLKFLKLLENDSTKSALIYLEKYKPAETDSTNYNNYKNNLANILIRERKFKEGIKLLSEVINSDNKINTIPERLLRSEIFVQVGQIEDAMADLTFVTEYGGRYRWRAYRQRGIIKYEILKDTVGGCMDLRQGVANDYTKKIFDKYCD